MKPPSDPAHFVDPPRLADAGDAADPSVVAALEAGRSRMPDPARMEAIARALAAKTTPPGGGHGPRGSSRALKVAGAAASVAAVGVLWIALHGRDAREAPMPLPAQSVVVPSAPVPPPTSEAVPTMDIESLPVSTPRDAGATPRARPVTEPGETEVRLLGRAQDALASQPADALRLCAEHERRFPQGAFTEEREVIAIDALVRLGRRDEAFTRGERFLRGHPGSAGSRRVRRLLGAD